ncbi:MAG: 50S ribosomal protein L1 [Armatimonadetes bacterium]|nr:50S ribosomal protein L1 [Armatimonadota bacterium]
MPKHSKRFLETTAAVDRTKVYEPAEAVELVKKTSTAKFDETVDVAVRLGVDPRHGDQVVRGTTNLPYGTGKVRRVAVFARGEKAQEAAEAGADVVGAEDLVQRIQGGWREFDVLLATPDMMPVIGRALGRTLGPRMPSPRSGTVTNDIGRVVRDINGATRVEYRVEKAGIIHSPIGKVSFPTEHLLENFNALLLALVRARPAAAKGRYLRGITLSSTMGPGVKIDPQRAQQLTERS